MALLWAAMAGPLAFAGADLRRSFWVQGVPLLAQRRAAQPRRAASMVAMSILRIVIMASNTRFAAARSGPL